MAVVTANGTRFTNGFIAKIFSANLHIRWPQAIDCGDMRGQHRCQICSFKHISLFHGAPDGFSRTLAIPAVGNLFGITDFHLFSSNENVTNLNETVDPSAVPTSVWRPKSYRHCRGVKSPIPNLPSSG